MFPHLIIVVSPGKSLESIGCKSAAGRIQLLSVVLRQLRAKGVDGDDERPAVICIICQEVFRIAKIFTSCPPQKRGSRTSHPPSPPRCSGRSCRRTQGRTMKGQLERGYNTKTMFDIFDQENARISRNVVPYTGCS